VPDGIRWVGLDVHARESTVAVFDQATGEVTTRRLVGRPHELLPWLRAVERPARMVYEAGPTGYGLARRALAEGIEIGVCAPSKTERPPADRVKTDKRDAIRLARLLAAGELTLVTIPSVEREQLRARVMFIQHCFSSRRSLSNSPACTGFAWIRRPFRLPCCT
jgi:transposase